MLSYATCVAAVVTLDYPVGAASDGYTGRGVVAVEDAAAVDDAIAVL
jgi:hypothetical protein